MASISERPKNIGVLAMDVYFPSTYVSQTDLEVGFVIYDLLAAFR